MNRTRVTCTICKRRVTTDDNWQEYGYLNRYECRQCTPVVTDEMGSSVVRTDPRFPMETCAGLSVTHRTYEGEMLQGVTVYDPQPRAYRPTLYIAFPDGTWASPTKWEL